MSYRFQVKPVFGSFVEGDRVACAGSGIASYAELNRVPHTLAVKIPDND
jgi:NADPH:quinone reductase-like Zn-dependent oxidoreductase